MLDSQEGTIIIANICFTMLHYNICMIFSNLMISKSDVYHEYYTYILYFRDKAFFIHISM